MNKELRIKNEVRQRTHNSLFLIPNSDTGMTLVETLIYAALISIIIGMIVSVAFQIISSNSGLSDIIFLEEEANFLLRKFEWAASGASSVNSPGSGSSSSSTLSLNKFEVEAGENPLVFSFTDGAILIQRGGGLPVPLNSAFITVENATFTHIAATGTAPGGILTELSLRNTSSNNPRNYSITTYLRQ